MAGRACYKYHERSAGVCRLRLKCDGTREETIFRLSAKRTSPFKSAGASVQSTTDSRGVRISGSNAGYTMFRGSVKSTSYPLHSPVSPSLSLPRVTLRHHISSGLLTRNWGTILDKKRFVADRKCHYPFVTSYDSPTFLVPLPKVSKQVIK